ncbi:MAG: DUF4040 domain-containing protein [Elainellaceae cyanobacterium]
MDDSYLYIIVALLPLASVMLVFQLNPYHALVIRGILGAIAALVYAMLGAADVALTEALVGTMLAVTLYAVAVRSSLVMRLGVLEDELVEDELVEGESVDWLEVQQDQVQQDRELTQPNLHPWQQFMNDLQTVLSNHYMRLELVTYPNRQSLHQALMAKELHATCIYLEQLAPRGGEGDLQPYQTTVRVRRLYEMMQAELSSAVTSLVYVSAPDIDVMQNTDVNLIEPGEAQP